MYSMHAWRTSHGLMVHGARPRQDGLDRSAQPLPLAPAHVLEGRQNERLWPYSLPATMVT